MKNFWLDRKIINPTILKFEKDQIKYIKIGKRDDKTANKRNFK